MKGALALRKPVQSVTVDMAVSNVTTAAWLQIVALLSFAASAVEIFNPSGSPMIVSQGAIGSETAAGQQFPYTVLPGGTTGPLIIEVKANKPISVKALDANVTSGRLIFNFFQ